MSRSIRSLAVMLLATCALTACGGDPEPIRAATAAELQTDLDQVAEAIDAGQCGRRVDAPLQRLDRDVGNLDDIDADLRGSLQDGVDRLAELAQQECEDAAAAKETTETETTTEPTTTEPETTTPPDTPTTAPQPGDGGQAAPADPGADPPGQGKGKDGGE